MIPQSGRSDPPMRFLTPRVRPGHVSRPHEWYRSGPDERPKRRNLTMHRSSRFILGLAVALALPAGSARSQVIGGPYGHGFGGWGSSTVGGSVAQGLGSLAEGAGSLRTSTAAARSVNADTVMRYNQYLYEAQQERNRSYYEATVRRSARTKESVTSIKDRVTNNPTTSDIERGDALNAILDQLTNPKVLQGGALQQATGTLDPKLIKDIPFRNAAEAVT